MGIFVWKGRTLAGEAQTGEIEVGRQEEATRGRPGATSVVAAVAEEMLGLPGAAAIFTALLTTHVDTTVPALARTR